MDNTRAGLGAVETGALRSTDVLTDVYLASAWTAATKGMSEMAGALGDATAAAEALAVSRKGPGLFESPIPRRGDSGHRVRPPQERKCPAGGDFLARLRPLALRFRIGASFCRVRARRSRGKRARRRLGRAHALARKRSLRSRELQQRRGLAVSIRIRRSRALRERPPGCGLVLRREREVSGVSRSARIRSRAPLRRPIEARGCRRASPAFLHHRARRAASPGSRRHRVGKALPADPAGLGSASCRERSAGRALRPRLEPPPPGKGNDPDVDFDSAGWTCAPGDFDRADPPLGIEAPFWIRALANETRTRSANPFGSLPRRNRDRADSRAAPSGRSFLPPANSRRAHRGLDATSRGSKAEGERAIVFVFSKASPERSRSSSPMEPANGAFGSSGSRFGTRTRFARPRGGGVTLFQRAYPSKI